MGDPGIWTPLQNGVRPTIDYVHAELHNGHMFSATHSVSVGTATAASILITAPTSAVAECHFTWTVEASNTGTYTFSEAPNASGGSAMAELNMDRNSANAASLVLTHTPTYVSSGTILENHVLGSAGIGNSKAGGGTDSRHEYILGSSTLYLIRFTAGNAGTTVIINSFWYEED